MCIRLNYTHTSYKYNVRIGDRICAYAFRLRIRYLCNIIHCFIYARVNRRNRRPCKSITAHFPHIAAYCVNTRTRGRQYARTSRNGKKVSTKVNERFHLRLLYVNALLRETLYSSRARRRHRRN
jgi:hypothetical protein